MPVPTFSGGVEAKNGCVHTSIAPPAASTAASPQSTVHIARDKVPACFNGNTFRLLLAMACVVLAVTRRDINCNPRTPRRVPRFMMQIETNAHVVKVDLSLNSFVVTTSLPASRTSSCAQTSNVSAKEHTHHLSNKEPTHTHTHTNTPFDKQESSTEQLDSESSEGATVCHMRHMACCPCLIDLRPCVSPQPLSTGLALPQQQPWGDRVGYSRVCKGGRGDAYNCPSNDSLGS